MRVTKTIRAYIEKEVKTRVMPKYEAEKAEADRQVKARFDFHQACAAAARKAYEEYFNAHFGEIADFCHNHLKETSHECYYTYTATIRDQSSIDSVYMWDIRFNNEVKSIVEDIVVELELGGDKKRLMELLNEI